MKLSRFFYIFLLFSIINNLSAGDGPINIQNSKSVYLSGVDYTFQFKTGSDTLAQIITIIKDNKSIRLNLVQSKNDKSIYNAQNISFPESGKWQIQTAEDKNISFWVIPGWFSLLPPFIAILLALITRQVLVALFAGVFFGATLIAEYNPLVGFLNSLSEFIAKAPANPDNMAILVFSLTLGGMVGVISKSGGTQGIVEWLSKYASDSRRGQLVTWAMGIVIFFDDYANTLIVGNTMRPLTDRLKISREKLAYLVDSTAAPIATVAIVSTWIGYQLSLIDNSFKTLGISENAYVTFIKTIPFAFYPIFTLLFGFLIAVTGRDFLSMLTAEKRAKHEGKLLATGATPLADLAEEDILADEGTPLRWYNALIPVAAVIIATIGGLWLTGVQATGEMAPDVSLIHYLSTVFGNASSFKVLIWGAFIGSTVAIVLAISQKILSLNNSIKAWVSGVKSMLMAALILVLAWSIGNICKEVQTADYVIWATADLLSPNWVPTVTFLIAGIIAFSTGTSWATMAILTPIVIPLAYQLPLADPTISAATQTTIFLSSIAAILAGSTFGDHCSPISDTTIMSSMASGSDHIDHVRTQMPYAIVVALVSIIFGFIPAGFGFGGLFEMILGAIVLFLIVRFVGKKA
jgi:Na+/H+ antiporter NhaC